MSTTEKYVVDRLKSKVIGSRVVHAVALGIALSAGAQALVAVAQQSTPPPPKVARVRAKLDGFDIAPTSGKAPNQIGGASRDLGVLTLYAPKLGKAYTLTPTFYWSGDDRSEYTFKLAALSTQESALYVKKVTGGKFTYPADAPALKPSETYIWSVQPENDLMGGLASASLLIVGGANRTAVESSLATAKASTADPSAEAAKVYVDHRLWFDAIATYSSLIDRHPEMTEYYKARAAVYDQLPETRELADADAAKVQHQ